MKYKTRSEHKQKDPKDYELALSINPEYLDEIYGEVTSPEIKKTLILMWVEFFGKRPNQYSKDPVEKKLGQALANYISKEGGCYDPEFAELINKLSPIIDTAKINKEMILEFVENNNGDRPNRSSKDPVEKKLGQVLVNYTSKGAGSYDPEFAELINKLSPIIDTAKINKEMILEFVERNNGKRPNGYSKDPVEKKLGRVLASYISKSTGSYDPGFAELINKLSPVVDTVKINKEKILEFVEDNNGKRPNRSSKDPVEKKLAEALNSYTCKRSGNNGSYDHEFIKLINQLSPIIDTVKINKEKIIKFIENNEGKRPRKHSRDPEERKLGQALGSYTFKGGNSYNLEFAKLINKLTKK